MAGCMVFVFAALAEFVVVKVLDVQYQQQLKDKPKPILPLRLTSAMEKGQCQTVAVFDGHGTNVRSRKANSQTPTTPVQVSLVRKRFRFDCIGNDSMKNSFLLRLADKPAGQWRAEADQSKAVNPVSVMD
jgi:hypothetical protein